MRGGGKGVQHQTQRADVFQSAKKKQSEWEKPFVGFEPGSFRIKIS